MEKQQAGQTLIYGAYGYTGKLVAAEAVRRGVRPVLAGRSAEPLERLGAELGLEVRAFSLDDPAEVRAGLDGVGVVIHCAGPFEHTAEPMLRACLERRAHYLDITGEITAFAIAHGFSAQAEAAGITLLPGAGFDVVPSDCLAAHLARRLPGAIRLTLAFQGIGRPSRGTATTMALNAHRGGAVRRDGRIVSVPPAWHEREIDLGGGPVTCVSIPWGDVFTAGISTGIPNIEVLMAAPPHLRRAMRTSRWLRPLLALPPVRRAMVRRVRKGPEGPTEEQRRNGASLLWGEAVDAEGRAVVSRLKCPEGYTLTALSAVELTIRVGEGRAPSGFQTPSTAFGPDFAAETGWCTRTDEPEIGSSADKESRS